MSSLPEDIHLEILLRVPPKSTCVCKCVCKSWFEYISNPNFIKMHLDTTTSQRKHSNLMFESYDKKKQRWSVKSISHDSLRSLSRSTESELVKKVLKLRNSFFFYNPATKEYKRIIAESRHSYSMVNAFGYDCKADDYKLIIMNGYDGTLDVYTLGTDAWKSSQTVPYKFPDMRQTGIPVNGAFHWLGKERRINSPKLIVVVDFSNFKCGELQLPDEILEMKHLRMTIGVLEGRLCVFVTISEVCFKVWVMQDYGVQESWIERYVFARELITRDYALKFMSTFRNGQILLKTGYELFLYDPKHSSTGRKHRISSCLRLLDAVEYVESLVSLNSGTYARPKK